LPVVGSPSLALRADTPLVGAGLVGRRWLTVAQRPLRRGLGVAGGHAVGGGGAGWSSRGIRCRALVATSDHGGRGGRAPRWSRGVCCRADAAPRGVQSLGGGVRVGGRAASVATRTPRRVRSRGSARADAAVVARRPLPRGRGATCGQLGGSGGCIGGCAASVEARTRRWVLGAAARFGRGGRGSGCAASVGGLVALRAASVGGLVGGRAASVAWRSRCRGPPRCQRAAGASVAALRPLLRGLGAACGRGVGGGCARPQSRGACCVAESLRRAVKWLGGGGRDGRHAASVAAHSSPPAVTEVGVDGRLGGHAASVVARSRRCGGRVVG